MKKTEIKELKKKNTTIFKITKFTIVNPIFKVYFRGKVIGGEKVPATGKLIIVSNHASVFDPPLLACGVNRPVSFMAKQELFSAPAFGNLITALGAYPVDREKGDRSAIRQAMMRIDTGWATCLFLEGTRTPDGRIYEPKMGAALISAKTQAPLLPVCLIGTEKILTPHHKFPQSVPVTIKIGDLIQPPTSSNKNELLRITAECADSINQLHQ